MYKIGQGSVLLYACMISFSAHIYTLVQSRLFPFSLSFYFQLFVIFFSALLYLFVSVSVPISSLGLTLTHLIDLSASPTISISTFPFLFFSIYFLFE